MRVGSDRSGQAMTEFVVALVGIMVVTAGLIQLSLLGILHTGTMIEARRQAGVAAMQTNAPFSGPQYIGGWVNGPDEMPYTRDDTNTSASVGDFRGRIVNYSHPDSLGEQVHSNAFTDLWQSDFPHLGFGLVDGHSTASMDLLPIISNLVYRADHVDVEGKAWLTWTTGFY